MELVVVIVIILIIASLAVPVIQNMLDDGRLQGAEDMVRAKTAEARAYAMEQGKPWRVACIPGSGTIMVAPDEHSVSLLDFEAAAPAEENGRQVVAHPGFLAPPDRTGPDVDRYALACLRLALFLPVTSLLLEHEATHERISTGLAALDGMLGGKGYYRGSTVLLSGTAGTGKTTLAAHFVDAACRRGEKCLYFLFEESPQQMIRNMQSAGIDVSPWVAQGLLQFHADRPNRHGLETHLLEMHKAVESHNPSVVVIDPITNLMAAGTESDVRAMLTRVIDYLKTRGVTALFTSLTTPAHDLEATEAMISSLMDSWVLVAITEEDRKRNRWLYVLKSRGMPHSNEVRSFVIGNRGIDLLPAEKPARAKKARRKSR